MGKAVTGPVAFLVSGLIDVALLIAYLLRRAWAALAVFVVVAAGVGVAVSAAPTPARASTTQASIIMDDDALIYVSPATVEANLKKIAALGINTVKVSVVWSLVAPDPSSHTEPQFNAADPNAYPAGNWDRYDTVVKDAQALGLNVYFQLTAPAPLWATNAKGLPARGYVTSNNVNPQEFAAFAAAVGTRYSGGYVPPAQTTSSGQQTITTPLGTYTAPSDTTTAPQTYTPIPAVHEWGIWNEPNEVGWLSPQTKKVGTRTVAASPPVERALTNDAYESLLATGHANDTILIGETASGGDITTIPFVQDLYCVNARNQPLRGSAATVLGCPASGNRAQFVEGNPGLFAATGYAHHPYSFNVAPSQREADKTAVSIANISTLENTIDAIFRTYGEPSGLPLYLTEYGYKTNPPNPTVSTTLAEQEVWLDQADYLTYEMPRVKALAQELLYDELPDSTYPKGSSKYWATYDSGLFYHDGRAKPSLAAYRLPIWLPSQKTGSRVAIWAQIRPGPHYVTERATLQFAPLGAKKWSTLATVSTNNLEGYLVTHVAVRQKGHLRLAWTDPLGSGTYYSRTVPIS